MNNLVLLFSGDFVPDDFRGDFQTEMYDQTFSDLRPLFDKSDFHISNLECPLTLNETPIQKTGPAIKSSPAHVIALKKANIDIACLANNHIRDYGTKGIMDTIRICSENDIHVVGAGKNLSEASNTLYVEKGGQSIAIINCCESEFSIADEMNAGAHPTDPVKIFYKIREAKAKASHIIVIFHGGHEYLNIPSLFIRNFFRYCADLGASAVIGHHTHVISGYEIYNGVPLIYSLGNFYFHDDANNDPRWFTGIMAEIELHDAKQPAINIHPVRLRPEENRLFLLKGTDKDQVMSKIKDISSIIKDDVLLEKTWNAFADKRLESLIKTFYGLSKFQKLLVVLGYPLRKLFKPKQLLLYLNYTRCESHRALLLYSLKSLLAGKENTSS